MKSEVQQKPGALVTFQMPRGEDERFEPGAPAKIIGKRPPLVQPDGVRYSAEIVAAWFNGPDLMLTIRVGEPE